ncbi:MAG: NADH-quinone oxidoreductase subunit N [Acidimicrobiia bacterium]
MSTASTKIALPIVDFFALGPEIALASGACLLLIARAIMVRSVEMRARKVVSLVLSYSASLVALGLALADLVRVRSQGPSLTAGSLIANDAYSASFKLVFAAMAVLAIAMGYSGLSRDGRVREEFGALVLLACAGMMAMVSAVDLIVVFLALELFSISFYVLAGFLRDSPAPQEAALKYFLLGSFASAFLLYGIALAYGGTGSLNLGVISSVSSRGSFSWLLLAGTALLLSGLAFKVGAVPFHMWVPDVYQGAPSYTSGFLAAGAKAAGFGAAMRIFAALVPSRDLWLPLVVGVGVVTMIVGAAAAIGQQNVKRMLGYSSIVHAGYLFLGVASPVEGGAQATLFYIVTYAAMIFGAFAIVAIFQRERTDAGDLVDFRGMGRKRPLLGVGLTILLLGLAGIPPTAGFIAKLYLFRAAVQAGLVWFALAGATASVVAAFFYIRLVIVLYQPEEKSANVVDTALPAVHLDAIAPGALSAAIFATVAVTLILGVFPQPALGFAEAARLIGGG